MRCSFFYNVFPIAMAVSHMRFENPHSLSYHAVTCIKWSSITRVWVASKIELCLSFVKSMDTKGLSLYPNISDTDANIALLTDSAVARS